MKQSIRRLLAGVFMAGLAFSLAPKTAQAAEKYVLMNIPYGEFYEAEGVSGVDAVTSATKNKPRTGTLAGGSYHVNADGTDITGVTYPVKVEDDTILANYTEITEESSVDITVTNRGTTTTTTYSGKEALFEAPSYAYYVLSEKPSHYKTLKADGSFSAVQGETFTTVYTASADVTVGARHADIEIALSGTAGIAQGDAVSGIVLTDSDGKKYALRHIVNIWRTTEIGWNLSDFDLNGKTITNVRYYTPTSVIDYPLNIRIGSSGYVLMNIPYDKFYEGEGVPGVDAVTSATKSKPRAGTLAGGSYHVNSDGSDITGITYPVFVKDMSALQNYTQVTDENSLTITVKLRGQENTTTYTGKETLFEAPSYAYYVLNEKPARYKVMNEDGSFSVVNGRAASVEGATGEVTIGARHADVEVSLSGTTGIEKGDTVSAIIMTDSDGKQYGLRHIANIWRGTEIGWSNSEMDMTGKTIKNLRYYTQDAVIDFPVEIPIVEKQEEPSSEEPTSEEPTSEEPSSEEPTSEEPGSEEPTSEEPVREKEIVKGKIYTVDDMFYRVTDAGKNGKGTVTLIKASEAKKNKMKSVSMRRTVKIYGKTFYITAIGNNAFRGFTKLQVVNIGNGVKKIGKRAFAQNPALQTVVIGKSVDTIGKLAFSGCDNLSSLTIKTTNLTKEKVEAKAFAGTPENLEVRVARKVLKAYKKLLVEKGISGNAVIASR